MSKLCAFLIQCCWFIFGLSIFTHGYYHIEVGSTFNTYIRYSHTMELKYLIRCYTTWIKYLCWFHLILLFKPRNSLEFGKLFQSDKIKIRYHHGIIFVLFIFFVCLLCESRAANFSSLNDENTIFVKYFYAVDSGQFWASINHNTETQTLFTLNSRMLLTNFIHTHTKKNCPIQIVYILYCWFNTNSTHFSCILDELQWHSTQNR